MSEILWWKVINRRTLAFFTAGEKLVQRDIIDRILDIGNWIPNIS